MSDVTLNVPAEHVESFRQAVVEEMRRDVGSSLPRLLEEDATVLQQLLDAPQGEDVEITGETDALAHVAQRMAFEVVLEKIKGELRFDPLEEDQATEIRKQANALLWATNRTCALYDEGSRVPA